MKNQSSFVIGTAELTRPMSPPRHKWDSELYSESSNNTAPCERRYIVPRAAVKAKKEPTRARRREDERSREEEEEEKEEEAGKSAWLFTANQLRYRALFLPSLLDRFSLLERYTALRKVKDLIPRTSFDRRKYSPRRGDERSRAPVIARADTGHGDPSFSPVKL